MQKAHIHKISYFLPEKHLTNEDLFDLFPKSRSNSNLQKIGIEDRRIVEQHITASDLAVFAAEKLFSDHKVVKEDIDFVLFCAQEFDFYTPTTACLIQERLKLSTSCGSLDYNLGCTGFVYGLSLAKGLIETGASKNVLLLTASTVTKKIHPNDRSSRFIFGDGAAATLISAREGVNGIEQFQFGTDGRGHGDIIVEDGGGRNPISEKSSVEREDQFGNITTAANVYMDGASIHQVANEVVFFQEIKKV